MSKLKDVSLTFASNVLATLISMVVTLILPKFLGVTDYSYFQLYIFYFSYIGLLHFGWADGVFLRYGGAYYENLDRRAFSAQLRLYSAFQIIVAALLFAALLVFHPAAEKTRVFSMVIVAAIFANIRFLIQYILQGTSRIKEYATTVIVDKCVYILLVLVLLFAGEKRFGAYIIANLLGVAASLCYGLYCCRDIVASPAVGFKIAIEETWKNLSAGIKLMLAQLASQLIIGIVRQAIEMRWSVEQFGKVSLSLSISNMLMLLINAVAIVLFPMLRRLQKERLAPMYKNIRSVLMIPLFFMLLFYYPGKTLLSLWLPQYAESLRYLALLFPMCIFESKMSLLINTYLKTMRKEKTLMKVNVGVMLLSLILSGITVFVLEDIDLAVFSIVLLLGLRSVTAEAAISKALKVSVVPDMLAELALVAAFIIASWWVSGITGLMLYMVAYAIYCCWKRKEIVQIVAMLKRMFRHKRANGT